MECLIYSPAFNSLKMAWVAGVGTTRSVAGPGIAPVAGCSQSPAGRAGWMENCTVPTRRSDDLEKHGVRV